MFARQLAGECRARKLSTTPADLARKGKQQPAARLDSFQTERCAHNECSAGGVQNSAQKSRDRVAD